MKWIAFIVLIITLFSCGPIPDSSGKVYDIDPETAKEQLLLSLNEIIEDDDDNDEAYFRRSKLYYNKHQYKEAYADIKKALKINAVENEYHAHRIVLLVELKQYQAALRSIELLPEEYLFDEVKKAKLLAELRTGKIKDPELIRATMETLHLKVGVEKYISGMAAWKKRDTLLAKQYLEEAYEKGEKSQDLLLTLCAIIDSDDPDHFKYLEKAVTYHGNRQTRILLANYYIRNGDNVKEDSVYNVILKIYPKDVEVLSRKVALLNKQRKYQEIITLLEPLYESTNQLDDDLLLADTYFSLKINDKALAIYETIAPFDTTGIVKRNMNTIKWRSDSKKKKSDTLSTIAKDNVNSHPSKLNK